MGKRAKPRWADDYLRFAAWTADEFRNLLCGLPPVEPQDAPALTRERRNAAYVRDEKRRLIADRHVRDADAVGDLKLLEPPDEQLLEKIKSKVSGEQLEGLRRAVVHERTCDKTYRVGRDAAIRWAATRQDLFPNFPFSREDIAESGAGSPDATTRRAQVEEFLDRCNKLPDVPRRIIKKDIWRAARHTSQRQFMHWQARHAKATGQDEKTFAGFISMEPTKFVKLLTRRRMI